MTAFRSSLSPSPAYLSRMDPQVSESWSQTGISVFDGPWPSVIPRCLKIFVSPEPGSSRR